MDYEVITTANFEKAAKPLLKKYPSLRGELIQLESNLQSHPFMGTSLGNNTFKVRVAIKNKGKGKSGRARVITHLELDLTVEKETTHIFLLTIYDKSVVEDITDKEIEKLIKARNQRKNSFNPHLAQEFSLVSFDQ
jgi:hypothetical protein